MERELVRGLERYHILRDDWSNYLKWLLACSAAFQAALVWFVGAGVWSFERESKFLLTVASTLFLQIAGMGYIVVRCLFPEHQKKGSPPAGGKGRSESKTSKG
jgi:hypothetical protein